MADKNDKTLELKFEGENGDVIPSNLSSNELSEIITSIEDVVAYIILKDHSEFKKENIVLSLVDIKESSLKLNFRPKIKELILAAFITASTSISTNDYSGIPVKAIESLKALSSFCKKRKCHVEFRDNPDSVIPLASIYPDTPIEIPESFYVSGETTLYGDVIRVGGAEPRLALKLLGSEQTIYLDIDEASAKAIGKNLYSKIGVKGIAKWLTEDYSITDFKFQNIVPLENKSIKNAIEGLSAMIGEYWNNVTDVDKEIQRLRT